jgi:hypothetical protein
MSRFILLSIIAVAIILIAPLIGASRSVSVNPDQSVLQARTIFDFVEEVEGKDSEELRQRREDRREGGELEERRDDVRRFFEERD